MILLIALCPFIITAKIKSILMLGHKEESFISGDVGRNYCREFRERIKKTTNKKWKE